MKCIQLVLLTLFAQMKGSSINDVDLLFESTFHSNLIDVCDVIVGCPLKQCNLNYLLSFTLVYKRM